MWHNVLRIGAGGHVQCLIAARAGRAGWRPGSPNLFAVAVLCEDHSPSLLSALARMFAAAVILATAPLLVGIYAYLGYPVVLWMIAVTRGRRETSVTASDWPTVTVSVPVYNAASNIRSTLERLLELDYPRDRLQLLVISDGSTDGTDDIVRELADRGVELLRIPERKGKTMAENAALAAARGEIIVNVDATVQVPPGSLKPLIRAFEDSTVGVASSRDVSVGTRQHAGPAAESTYVGYEMWIRDLETRIGSIVGASGCFYAFRRSIRAKALRSDLSWDFASALVAREQGYRSVSVPAATCLVPRTADLRSEMKRKVRTMARGISTLLHYRRLMDPSRYGLFAFMLVSHKLLRWVPYLLVPPALLALAILATDNIAARILLGFVAAGVGFALIGIRRRESTGFKPVAIAAFALVTFCAGVNAWWVALRKAEMAMWEPTRRPEAQT